METLKQSVKRNKRQLSLLLCLALVFSLFGGIRVKEVKAETANEDTWIEATTTVSGSAATVKVYKYDKAPQELEVGAKYSLLKQEVSDEEVYPAKDSGETVTIVKRGKDEDHLDAESIYYVERTNGDGKTNGAITWDDKNGCWWYSDASITDGERVYLYSPSEKEVKEFRVEQKRVLYVYENGEASYVAKDFVRIVLTLDDKEDDKEYVIDSDFDLKDPWISDKDNAITLKWGDIELTAEMETTLVPDVRGVIDNVPEGGSVTAHIEGKWAPVKENGTFEISGVEPGEHTLKIMVCDNSTKELNRIEKTINLFISKDGKKNNYSSDGTGGIRNNSLIVNMPGKVGEFSQLEISNKIDAFVDDKELNKQFSAPVANDANDADKKGITQADLDKIDTGGKAKLKLQIGLLPETSCPEYDAHKPLVDDKAEAQEFDILHYYVIDFSKYVVNSTENVDDENKKIVLLESNQLIKIELPLEEGDTGRYDYQIYRYHDGDVEILTTTENADGEYLEVTDTNKLILHIKKFCLYAFARKALPVAPPVAPPIWYPTASPTPTVEPTAEPTAEPTVEPTAEPTAEPTLEPTVEPTAVPTVEPTAVPTAVPTKEPQAQPTASSKKQKVKTMLLEVEKVSGDTMTLSWDKVSGADGYDLYHSKCDTLKKKNKLKFYKTFKSAKTTSFTFKELKKDQWYKERVYAWKMVNGKKVVIGKSIIVHEYVKKQNVDTKWGNPTEVEVSEKKISLAKGKTAKLSAKVVTTKGKSLGDHGRKIRYVVSDDTIVSVTKKGKVKAKKKGKCTVYVVAQNGLKKKVKVTVK